MKTIYKILSLYLSVLNLIKVFSTYYYDVKIKAKVILILVYGIRASLVNLRFYLFSYFICFIKGFIKMFCSSLLLFQVKEQYGGSFKGLC